LNAQNVIIIWHFGGCCKLDLQMKRPLNFIDVLNVIILGEITHKYCI
jgi:hypothetical protein